MDSDILVDGCEESFSDIFPRFDPPFILWNGREMRIAEKSHTPVFCPPAFFPSCNISTRSIEQILYFSATLNDLLKTHDYTYDFENSVPEHCKSLWKHAKRIGKEIGKGVKKTGKAVEDVAKKTAHAAKKVVDFVKDHPKEIVLAAGAVVLGVAAGIAIAEALNSEASRKEEEKEPETPEVTADPPQPKHHFASEAPHNETPVKNETTLIIAAKQEPEMTRPTDPAPLPSTSKYLASFVLAPLKSALGYLSGLIGLETGIFSDDEKSLAGGKSRHYLVKGNRDKSILITFINGIDNSFEESKSSAEYIQSFTSNHEINGVYNHSNGKGLDLMESLFINYNGYSPTTKDLLAEKWIEFHEDNKDNPNAKCLHICHSQGAIHTYNTLMHLPEEIRNRVIVVGIAPGKVITKDLFYDAYDYASKNDIVHLGEDLVAQITADLNDTDREKILHTLSESKAQLILLEPHKDATGLDHEFISPTFSNVIKFHLRRYLN